MSLTEDLSNIEKEFARKTECAAGTEEIEAVRVEYLGKSGVLTSLLRKLGSLSSQERPVFGKDLNAAKERMTAFLEDRSAVISRAEMNARLNAEHIDTSLPGTPQNIGHLHPLTQTLQTVIGIFGSLGFEVAEGPDIETEYYNFDALNVAPNHPARDMQDTLFLKDGRLLRTHTSPVQIRVMENKKPPMRVIAPGKVYRCDADVSHSPMFHQIEGFMVDKDINFGHLKHILSDFLSEFFGQGIKVRFRPSYFPFTEPSAEIDISCILCGGEGKGCRVCKNSGWIEILGAGMIHPNVFAAVGYPKDKYTGFAFGMGIERIAMLKFAINDIRLFFENDIRFLKQF